jgi:hypothetical protein
MTMTPFFLELHAAYQSELDDLATDSEGRDVLQQRLREKRREIGFLAQMMELSPEMVAVVFHRGFQFREPAVMEQLLTLEADEFPDWDDVLVSVQLHPWAQDLAAIVRKQPAGEWFLTVAAVLEYLQGRRVALPAGADEAADSDEADGEGPARAERDDPFGDGDTDDAEADRISEEAGASLIAAGDIVGAESALADLADTEGDNALMVVLDQLAPKDVLAVMREYDDSKASVVNLLVTPEQFARAMVLEKQYKDLTHTHTCATWSTPLFFGTTPTRWSF